LKWLAVDGSAAIVVDMNLSKRYWKPTKLVDVVLFWPSLKALAHPHHLTVDGAVHSDKTSENVRMGSDIESRMLFLELLHDQLTMGESSENILAE
jgi:hypothetical protein